MRVIRPSEEGARVTTFELFFDLVFVFAFTQVSRLMVSSHSAVGVAQGLVVLGLLWWTWIAFAWLTNQTRADRGVVRIGLIVATVAVFVIGLAIPEAFNDLPGGLFAPMVLVLCYLLVHLVHGVLHFLAAGDDVELRRQVMVTVPATLIPSAILLIAGALVGGAAQLWLWLAALLVEGGVGYALSRRGWRVHSAAHWTERHGLVVILALGESLIAIGAGVALLPLSVPIVLGAVLAVLLAFGLWWAYFERMAPAGERLLAHREGRERVALARDAYMYLHFPLVAGVVIAALGLELAMAHVADPEELGAVGGLALGGGVALYLLSTFFFWWRVTGRRSWPRLASAVLFLAASALLAVVPALAALLVAVATFALVIVVEALAGRESRTLVA